MSGKGHGKWKKSGNCQGKDSVRENYCCNSVAIPGIIRVLDGAQLSAVQYSVLFMFCHSCAYIAY